MFSDGYAYIVQDADYAQHLLENTNDMKEVKLILALSSAIHLIDSTFS